MDKANAPTLPDGGSSSSSNDVAVMRSALPLYGPSMALSAPSPSLQPSALAIFSPSLPRKVPALTLFSPCLPQEGASSALFPPVLPRKGPPSTLPSPALPLFGAYIPCRTRTLRLTGTCMAGGVNVEGRIERRRPDMAAPPSFEVGSGAWRARSSALVRNLLRPFSAPFAARNAHHPPCAAPSALRRCEIPIGCDDSRPALRSPEWPRAPPSAPPPGSPSRWCGAVRGRAPRGRPSPTH